MLDGVLKNVTKTSRKPHNPHLYQDAHHKFIIKTVCDINLSIIGELNNLIRVKDVVYDHIY